MDPKRRAAALQTIQSQSVLSWGETEVGVSYVFHSSYVSHFVYFLQVWLEENGHKDLVKAFHKNGINGEQLASLSDDDLVSMKVDKLGVRKSLMKAISNLASGAKTVGGATSDNNSSNNNNVDEGSQSSTSSKGGGAQIKVVVDDGSAPNFSLALGSLQSVTFSKLARKLEKKIGYAPNIKSVVDGKETVLEDQSEWNNLLVRIGHDSSKITLKLSKPGPNTLPKSERALLEALVDAVVVADVDMNILFVNSQVTVLTGYQSSELVGRKVEMLMPTDVAEKHPSFIKRYLTTGVAKVIGKGREVAVVRKDKSVAPCWLSVTEQKKTSGRHTFLGTLHAVQGGKARSAAMTSFAVLDAVQRVAVVIDATGKIKFLNRHAESLLGWSDDAIGKNVSILMPEPYSSQHDSYLQNYLKSGKAKLIGKGARQVVGRRKDGSVVAIDLSLDEISLDGVRHFVGFLRESSKVAESESRSILQDTRGVVNSLSVPGIVIDRNGIIQAFNSAAESLLGYTMADVLGENVRMLMNSTDAAKHDSYISNYLNSGVAKVIGSTRAVLAKSIDGILIPVGLSISKAVNPEDPNEIFFTGIITPNSTANNNNNSSNDDDAAAAQKADRALPMMNSAGGNTVKSITGVPDFGVAEDQNVMHRTTMEDSWVVVDSFAGEKDSVYFGLFDGHNGKDAAEFCMNKLHAFAAKYVKTMPVGGAFEKSYLLTHEGMGSDIAKSGCTVVTCWLQRSARMLHTANVGDSRAVLVCDDGSAQRLTKDHKPNDPQEKKLVEDRGGVIVNGRVSGILAVSRSLGDYKAEKYVSRNPSFSSVKLSDANIALVVACDGLFDVCSDQEVAELVMRGRKNRQTCQKIAKVLVDTAIGKGTTDNVTVMVAFL